MNPVPDYKFDNAADAELLRTVRDALESLPLPAAVADSAGFARRCRESAGEPPPAPVPPDDRKGWFRVAAAAAAVVAVAVIALVLIAGGPRGANRDTPPGKTPPDTSPDGDPAYPFPAIREGDYDPPITTDYDGPRGAGTRILYGGDTVYVKNWSCPAREFQYAWLLKCGPNQTRRLARLERQGDRFVPHYEGRNERQTGFVLVVLVLSRTDSPLLGAKSNVAIDLDREVLDALSRLYRDPARNASAIRAYLANIRRAWGLPDDALLFPWAYEQVTQPNPGRDAQRDDQP